MANELANHVVGCASPSKSIGNAAMNPNGTPQADRVPLGFANEVSLPFGDITDDGQDEKHTV